MAGNDDAGDDTDPLSDLITDEDDEAEEGAEEATAPPADADEKSASSGADDSAGPESGNAGRDDSSSVDRADPPPVDNPFASDDDSTDAEAHDRSAPFGDLARDVGERRRRREETTDDDLFEHVEVSDVDEDGLWETLDETVDGVSTAAAEHVADADHGVGPEHVVDKREYCQQCPFFSAPPEVACGHDGTDIVEVVDAEHFRVRGCPMVTETGRPNFRAVAEDADADDESESSDGDAESTGGESESAEAEETENVGATDTTDTADASEADT